MSSFERQALAQFQKSLSTARTYENVMGFDITYEKKWVVRKGMHWPVVCCEGTYLYVVLPDGEIRFPEKPWPESQMRHPELCNGKDVIAAGIFTIKESKIVSISNESGHYGPSSESLYYAKMAFRFWGAPFSDELKEDGHWEMFGNNY